MCDCNLAEANSPLVIFELRLEDRPLVKQAMDDV
jgi:hypothetical protein